MNKYSEKTYADLFKLIEKNYDYLEFLYWKCMKKIGLEDVIYEDDDNFEESRNKLCDEFIKEFEEADFSDMRYEIRYRAMIYDAQYVCPLNTIEKIKDLPSLAQIVNNHFGLYLNTNIENFSSICRFVPLVIRDDGFSLVWIYDITTKEVICSPVRTNKEQIYFIFDKNITKIITKMPFSYNSTDEIWRAGRVHETSDYMILVYYNNSDIITYCNKKDLNKWYNLDLKLKKPNQTNYIYVYSEYIICQYISPASVYYMPVNGLSSYSPDKWIKLDVQWLYYDNGLYEATIHHKETTTVYIGHNIKEIIECKYKFEVNTGSGFQFYYREPYILLRCNYCNEYKEYIKYCRIDYLNAFKYWKVIRPDYKPKIDVHDHFIIIYEQNDSTDKRRMKYCRI